MAAAASALALFAGLAIHSAPVRSAVLRWAVAELASRAGIVLTADSLDYNLLALRVTLSGVTVAAAESPASPFLTADAIAVAVPRSVLFEPFSLNHVRLDNARIAIVRRPDGTTNLPSAGGDSAREPPAIVIDRIEIPRLAVGLADQRDDLSLSLPSMAVDVRRDRGSVHLAEPGSLRRAGVTTSISGIDGGVSFDGRTVRLDRVSLTISEAAMTLDGTLALLAREARADVRVRGQIDLARLVRWARDDLDLDGALRLNATVAGPLASPSVRLRLSTARLTWERVTLTDLSADIDAGNGRVRVSRLAAFGLGGRLALSADHTVSTGQTALEAEWAGIDTAALHRTFDASTQWSIGSSSTGSAVLAGSGADWTQWTIDARTRLVPRVSAHGRIPVGGTVAVALASRRWRLAADSTVFAVGLEARLRGTVNPARPSSSSVAGTIVVRETELPALLETLGAAGITTAADAGIAGGRVSIEGVVSGALTEPRIRATVAVRDLAGLISGVDADVLAEGSVERLEVEVRLRHGEANSADVSGTVWTTARRIDLDVSARVGDVAALLPDAAATGHVDVVLRAEGPIDAPTIRGSATVTDVHYRNVRMDRADATITVDPALAYFDIVAPEIGAHARVAIDRPARRASIDLQVNDSNLTRLVRDIDVPTGVAGTITLTGRATIPIDDWRSGTAAIEIARLEARAGDLPIHLAEPGLASYEAGELTVSRLEADLGETRLSVAGRLPVTSASVEMVDAMLVSLTGDLAHVIEAARASGLTGVPELGARGALAVRARVTGSLERPEIAADVDLAGGEIAYQAIPPVRAVQLRGRIAGGRIDLVSAEAEWQNSRLSLAAEVPLHLLASYIPPGVVAAAAGGGTATLDARIDGVTPRVLEPFLEAETIAQIEGTLDASLHLEADALEIDHVRGAVRLDRLDLRVAGLAVAQREPTRVTLDGGVARVASWEWTGQGATLIVQGEVGLIDQEVALLTAGRIDLRTLAPFIRTSGVALSGTLAPRFAVVGPLSSPRIDGELALTSGEIRLRQPRIMASNVNAFAVMTPTAVRATSITGSVNGGMLTGSASAQFQAGLAWSAQVQAAIDGMGIEFPEGLRSELDADLALALGDTPRGPGGALTGTVTIVRSAYRQPLAVMTRLLSALRADRLGAVATESAAGRIALNVSVATDADVTVDNNVARLQLGGDLRVIGTAAAPALSGRAFLREGGQLFLGRNVYTVDSGTIDFANPLSIEPDLQVEATTRAGGHDIELVLSGRPDTMDIDVRSLTEPELGQADVTSLLLTGRLLEDVPGSEGRIVGEQVLAYVSGDVLGLAGRAIGFDTVRLGGAATSSLRRDPAAVAAEADPISRLTFGKTFGEQFEVTFSQSLRQGGASTWIVDYRPVRQVDLRLVSRDDNLRSYEFRHDVAIGGGTDRGRVAARRGSGLRIAAVEITGTAPLSDAALRGAVDVAPGDAFDVGDWQQARDRLEQALWRAGFLEARVTTTRQDAPAGVELSFEMTAGPRTVVAVSGHELTRATRAAIEAAWTQSVFDDFLREEVEVLVRRTLLEAGYVDPRVTIELTEREMKTLAVVVAAGPRARGRRLTIEAADGALARDLERWVRDERLQELAWREPDALTRALAAELRNRGHIDATVAARAPRLEGSTAVFGFDVDPGPRYRVSEVRLPVSAPVSADALRAAVALDPGGPYDPAAAEAARTRVLRVYRREGFAGARVTIQPVLNPAERTVALVVEVDEGQRDVLRDIEVRGTRSVDADVVTREMDLKIGQPLGAEAWLQARTRLFDTALFRRVDVTAEPLADDSGAERPMRAVATIQEWPALRVRYGFQLSEERPEGDAEGQDLEPGLSADVTRRTLFGRALTTGAAAEFQRRERLARLFANAPTFAGLPVESLLSMERARQYFADATFLSDRSRVSWEQRMQVAAPLRVSYSYSFERNRTFDTGPRDPFAPAFDVTVNIARLTGAAILDTRDDPTDTRGGSLASWNVEYAPGTLGSDLSFLRQLAQAYYFRPWRALTLATAARFGIVVPLRGQTLIPSELFFAGGARTVRGVDQDSLGSSGLFGGGAGGRAMVIVNQEVRFPIYRFVRGVGFIDAGNVFASPSSIDLRRLTGASGAGFRVMTPFALLRVDYGRVIFGRPAGSARWTFGIGQTF